MEPWDYLYRPSTTTLTTMMSPSYQHSSRESGDVSNKLRHTLSLHYNSIHIHDQHSAGPCCDHELHICWHSPRTITDMTLHTCRWAMQQPQVSIHLLNFQQVLLKTMSHLALMYENEFYQRLISTSRKYPPFWSNCIPPPVYPWTAILNLT